MHNHYTQYYTLQEGGSADNNQFLQLKLPRVYQRGNGVGGVFSSIWRFLQPIFKSGANFLKNELTETGIDLIKGINEQKPLKEILRDRSLKVVDNLGDLTKNKINKMAGSGRKRKRRTSTIKRKSKRIKRHLSSSSVSRSSKKKNSKRTKKINKVHRKKSKSMKVKPRLLDIFS